MDRAEVEAMVPALEALGTEGGRKEPTLEPSAWSCDTETFDF